MLNLLLEHLSSRELFALAVGLCGGAFMLGKLLGVIHIGTRDECPDPGCKAQVTRMANDIAKINETLSDQIFPKINQTAEDMAFIKGKLNGDLL